MEASATTRRLAGPGLQDACLGIDIGSHRTRAVLWANGEPIVIENEHSYSLDGSCLPGDFPSSLYVFGKAEEEVYLSKRGDTSRRSVSAKYAFYALADASDTLLEQYPLVRHLTERKSDPGFQDKLRRGLVALLTVVREAALVQCRHQGLRISKIGLTIPVQWTLEFEDVYLGLVCEVFNIDSSAIYFYTETEALARYLYKHHRREFDPNSQHDAVMFFDFGGHNMNGCLFAIAHDPENPETNSFLRVGKAFGAGGGSGQWEHHICEMFSSMWREHCSKDPPPEDREYILSQFRMQEGVETALRKSITRQFVHPVDCSPIRINLELEHIEDAWRRGLEGPLNTAEHEISRLVKIHVKSGRVSQPVVVVSGGTARNPAVKSQMSHLCRDYKVPVVFTEDIIALRQAYYSAKVATAAAYVVSEPETLTVEQFLRRGAAVGIQMRQAPKKGEPARDIGKWDDSGALLLEKLESYRGDEEYQKSGISTRHHDEFRLICDPFFGQLAPAERKRVDAGNRSYDVVYLGKREQGSWLFYLNIEREGATLKFVLEQFYKRTKRLQWQRKTTLRLPVYFDGNSGCIHVGARNKSIAELGLDLPPQPDDLEQTTVDHGKESNQEPPAGWDVVDQRRSDSSYIHAQLGLGTDENRDLDMFPTAARSRSSEAQGVLPSPRRRRGEKPQCSLKETQLDLGVTECRMREVATSHPRCEQR